MSFSDFDGLPGADILDDGEPDEEGIFVARPRTRGDCAEGPRPCPWVSCKYHLLTDIAEDGRLFFNGNASGSWKRPLTRDDEAVEGLTSMPETCALDVAEGGGCGLEAVAAVLGAHPEHVRKIETKSIVKIRSNPAARAAIVRRSNGQ